MSYIDDEIKVDEEEEEEDLEENLDDLTGVPIDDDFIDEEEDPLTEEFKSDLE